jgi:multidrug efflux pump
MCATRSTWRGPNCRMDADEPTVNEVNLSEFPILVITLSGDVPERVLAKAGRELA